MFIDDKTPIIRGGRKAEHNPANPETKRMFERALQMNKLRSFRQWAIKADIPYRQFTRYARGEQIPPLDKAAVIAKAGKVSIDYLYSHLAEKPKTPAP